MTDPESAKEELHEERMTDPSAWVAVKALKEARLAGLKEALSLLETQVNPQDNRRDCLMAIRARIEGVEKK